MKRRYKKEIRFITCNNGDEKESLPVEGEEPLPLGRRGRLLQAYNLLEKRQTDMPKDMNLN